MHPRRTQNNRHGIRLNLALVGNGPESGSSEKGQPLFFSMLMMQLNASYILITEVEQYLAQENNPNTINELLAFIHLIGLLQGTGMNAFWDAVKPQIKNQVVDNYYSKLKLGHQNEAIYPDVLEVGEGVALQEITRFHQPVQESAGYHKYCRQFLRQNSLFACKSKDAMANERHRSEGAQRQYDQYFGLVVRGRMA